MRGIGVALGSDPRGSYLVRLRAAALVKDFPVRSFLSYGKNSTVRGQRSPTMGVVEVTGTMENPSITVSTEGENLGSSSHARKLLQKFAFEAFRRVQPSPQYLDKLVDYFQSRMEQGLNYEDAMSETLGLVLVSPGFLYLEEPAASDTRLLDGRALATRLAYFLWSAPPDEELYRVGQSSNPLSYENKSLVC